MRALGVWVKYVTYYYPLVEVILLSIVLDDNCFETVWKQ